MSFNKMYGTFPSGRWLFTGTLSGGTDFPLLDLFTYMSWWSWGRAPSATAIHSSEWCLEMCEKSHDDLLPKIFNTLCGDWLRPGPPPVLLKVKNWRPPNFHESFVTQLLEPCTFSVSGKFTKKTLPRHVRCLSITPVVFSLKDTFKIPYTLEG